MFLIALNYGDIQIHEKFFGEDYISNLMRNELMIDKDDISVDAARKLYYAGAKKLLAVIIEMDAVKKMTDEERKRADVAKQKWYSDKNRGKVKARRRAHYARNKDKINAKRRAEYAAKKRRNQPTC